MATRSFQATFHFFSVRYIAHSTPFSRRNGWRRYIFLYAPLFERYYCHHHTAVLRIIHLADERKRANHAGVDIFRDAPGLSNHASGAIVERGDNGDIVGKAIFLAG